MAAVFGLMEIYGKVGRVHATNQRQKYQNRSREEQFIYLLSSSQLFVLNHLRRKSRTVSWGNIWRDWWGGRCRRTIVIWGGGEGRGMGALATVISLSLQLCSQRPFVKSERAVTRLSQPWSCHEYCQNTGSITFISWSGGVTGWKCRQPGHDTATATTLPVSVCYACHDTVVTLRLSRDTSLFWWHDSSRLDFVKALISHCMNLLFWRR